MNAVIEVQEPEVKESVEGNQAAKPLVLGPPIELPLFGDVLLEAGEFQRRRRGVSAVFSFCLQCLIVAVLAVIPLMFTDELPRQQLLTFLVAPPPPPPPPPPAAAEAVKIIKRVESDLLNGQLRTPTKIPTKVEMIKEEEAPPPISGGGVIGGVPGGIPGGQLGGVIGGIISASSSLNAVPKLAPVMPKRLRVSQGVTTGQLIRKLEPKYPPLAQQARIQGQVVLNAIISKTGVVENLELVSGHPMLVPAALDAVKQWRYRPFLLNGEPVEVETTITVTFHIAS